MIQGEGGAQILVDPELEEHFCAALTQVRTVPVETRAVPLSELRVAPPKKMAISSIEASLRLDAVASAGEAGGSGGGGGGGLRGGRVGQQGGRMRALVVCREAVWLLAGLQRGCLF